MLFSAVCNSLAQTDEVKLLIRPTPTLKPTQNGWLTVKTPQRRGQPTIKGTELDTRLKAAIALGTFVLGLFTVIVPAFAIPDCVPDNVAKPLPPVKPFEPFVRPKPPTRKSPQRPVRGPLHWPSRVLG